MSNTITMMAVISGSSVSIQQSLAATGESLVDHSVASTAGDAGTLSTRSDANTGICTLAEGHGITDAMTVDVYWSGGMRYGMTVTGYDTTTVTVDAGAGDDFPAQGTAVVVGVRTTISDSAFTGNNLQGIVIQANYRASVDFLSVAGASLWQVEIEDTNGGSVWFEESNITNPLAAASVASIVVSSGTAVETTVHIAGVLDTVS